MDEIAGTRCNIKLSFRESQKLCELANPPIPFQGLNDDYANRLLTQGYDNLSLLKAVVMESKSTEDVRVAHMAQNVKCRFVSWPDRYESATL